MGLKRWANNDLCLAKNNDIEHDTQATVFSQLGTQTKIRQQRFMNLSHRLCQ